ncbi:hypothetical protein CLOP_g15942, partial [Closterium sp. NIES-67]
RSREA